MMALNFVHLRKCHPRMDRAGLLSDVPLLAGRTLHGLPSCVCNQGPAGCSQMLKECPDTKEAVQVFATKKVPPQREVQKSITPGEVLKKYHHRGGTFSVRAFGHLA